MSVSVASGGRSPETGSEIPVRAAHTDTAVHYRDIVNSMPTAMLVLDAGLVVQFANLAFYQLFGGSEAETLGTSVFSVAGGAWSDPEIRLLLEAVLPHDVSVNGYMMEQTFPIIGRRILCLTARRVVRDGAGTDQVLIEIQDVTGAEMASRAAEETIAHVDAMMTEIHHRVKNNISSILSMLRVESRLLADPDAREVLDRISLRVESMGALYELLAVNENTGQVGLASYFQRVCRSIETMSGASRLGWTIEVAGDDVAVGVDDAIALGAVVNELVANAAKYAFDGVDAVGRIRVALADRGTELIVTVDDNGTGFDDHAVDPKSTGLGMRLVEMYLGNLGGALERETGPAGTRYLMRIPRGDPADVASDGSHGETAPKPPASPEPAQVANGNEGEGRAPSIDGASTTIALTRSAAAE